MHCEMELLLMVIALHALCLFQGLKGAAISSNENVTYPNSTDEHEEKESEFYMLSLSQVCSGTLGAFYNGSWVAVSLQSLSILGKDDIGHICNSLGCGGVFDFRENNTAPVNTCLTGCVFINSTLHNCSTTALDNCLKLMEIVCERQAVRLNGGKDKCEGRVELLNTGLWGSVCDDEWDSNGGNVVCGQLDCGTAVHVTHKASWFGQGTGPVYISKLNCTGNEQNLWECSTYNHRDNNYCGHKEDAGVVCSESSNISVIPSITLMPNQTNRTTESLEKTVESSMLSSAVLGCIVLSIVLVFALFLISAQCIYYRKRNAGGTITRIISLEANSDSSSEHYYNPVTSTNATINNLHTGGFEARKTSQDDTSETSSDSDYEHYYNSPPAATNNIHTLGDDPVVAECNQEQEKVSREENAVKNKPHYAESDSESTSSGECYENTQAEEEEPAINQFYPNHALEMQMLHLHNADQPPERSDAVSDSESTSSGECYENTQAEEEELLNPVEETQLLLEQPPVSNPSHQTAENISLPQSYCQDQDDSSTSSEEAYENVPEIHDDNCIAVSEPPRESSDDSDYDDIGNW